MKYENGPRITRVNTNDGPHPVASVSSVAKLINKGEVKMMENKTKSLKTLFLCLLYLAFAWSFGQVGWSQEAKPVTKTDMNTETARHYILLLDATGSFTKSFGTGRYFSFVQEMITNNTITQEGFYPYRPGRDIVSVVFFHFPIHPQSRKITNKGFHTFDSLALIKTGIETKRSEIDGFVYNNLAIFKEVPVSPICLAEVTVLPYLNNYIKNLGIGFNRRIDKIYVISLNDRQYVYEEAGITSSLESFANETLRNYYNELHDYVQKNFEGPVKLKYIEKSVPSRSGVTRSVYFHYYEIKPIVTGIELKLTNKVAMDRAARLTSNPGEPGLLWTASNEICLDNQTGNLAWVEWALPPTEKNKEWNWHNCTAAAAEGTGSLKVLSAGCRAGCGGDAGNTKIPVQIAKPETTANPEKDANNFKVAIWYRGAVELPPQDHAYAYPFKARAYITPQPVEYVSNEAPNYYYYDASWLSPRNLLAFFDTQIETQVIDDNLLKEKLTDGAFLAQVEEYINEDIFPKRYQEYCETFRGKTIAELPAEILSEASNIKSQSLENWAKWRTLFLYLLIIGTGFFIYRYYLRPIIVRFNIDPVTIKNNTIVLDFSSDEQREDERNEDEQKKVERKKVALATIDLENLVYSLYPAKRNPKFKLSFEMQCEFSYPAEPLHVNSDRENLLSLMDKTTGFEYPLKTSGNSFHADVPDARFKGKFDLLLDLTAIEDVESDNIGDKLIPFTITLTSPQAQTSSGHALHIHKMKIGTEESFRRQWEYSAYLLIKPEKLRKEIIFKPIPPLDGKTNPHTGENFALDFTSKKPLVKLFEVEIKNINRYHFSFPMKGIFSFNVKGTGNKPVDNIFYMSEKELTSTAGGGFPRELSLCLKKADSQKKLNLYIHFDEIANPVDHWDYIINSYFEGEIVKTLNIRIDRSKEETEGLVQVTDEDEAIAMEVGDADCLTGDNSILVHKNLTKSLQAGLSIPVKGRKGIKEGSETKLFTLDLKNNCSTRTGCYRWEIKGISIEGDTHIEFEKDPIKLFPNETAGTIADHRDDLQEIEFRLDPARIKKVHTYNFGFKARCSIGIQLYPAGETGQAPAGGEKQIDFSIDIQCFHDVKDNYLVVDFGTSAISAYYYTHYPETPGQNYVRIPLKSPVDQMPSEDDLLPSTINLRNVARDGVKDAETVREVDDPGKIAVAGTEQFVDLPAREDILDICPDTVLNSIKLLIVQGVKIAPIPEVVSFGLFGEKRPFAFIDEKGNVKKGFPTLESILKSCYNYLVKNYINMTQKGYRKVVLTYPNVYNYSHIFFLQDEVFKEVFQESGRVYFENIGMESESNSVLYYYLSRRKAQDAPDAENVLVIDIGAGTLDMSYAKIMWKKWAQDAGTPKHIEIIKRDGIAMAGDSLDKAIALQVHTLLERFTQFEDVAYVNKIASTSELDLTPERKHILKKVMFAFKIRHILNFKRTMAESDDDESVEICLGENDKQNDLCELLQESHDISLAQDQGDPITVTLKNKYGKLYIAMKKKDWLNLPYLKRFEQLLIEKLGAFTKEIDIPNDLTIVMSGRASLWPAISKAVATVFAGVNIDRAEYIWPDKIAKKALELKRAVILGAVQKATTWKEVEFNDNIISGVEAVRYQKGADGSKLGSWSIELFPKKPEPSITINLDNSSYFELGIKTSMDFVPFMGADSYKRDDYCQKNKEITISLEKLPDSGGYHFYVKSDKYQRGKGTRLTHILSHETAFLRARARYWPVKDAQLREIGPEEFNENV
jgi:hypothetical protein